MNNLAYYRHKKGITQTELAENSGVLQTEISRAEKGAKDLKGLSWLSLARALDCSVDDLLRTNSPEIQER